MNGEILQERMARRICCESKIGTLSKSVVAFPLLARSVGRSTEAFEPIRPSAGIDGCSDTHLTARLAATVSSKASNSRSFDQRRRP
jgi:hypothetical protein